MPLPERVALDRSAFYVLLSPDDTNHQLATSIYERLIDREQELWTTSCILTEVLSFARDRYGSEVMRILAESLRDVVHIYWIDRGVFEEAWNKMIDTHSPELNIVDFITAVVAGRLRSYLFTFNKIFAELGIPTLPR